MKKAAAFIAAFAFTVITAAGAFAISPSSVKISGSGANAKTVTYQYTPGEEASKPITALMTEIGKITKKNTFVTQVLTLTSESTDNSEVEFKLRLVSSELPTPSPKTTPRVSPSPTPEAQNDYSDSILGFYGVTVRDSAGVIISSSKKGGEDIYEAEDGTLVRDINLGVLNKQSGKETKLYNVEISIDGSEAAADITNAQKKIKWHMASGPVSEVKPTGTPESKSDEDKPEVRESEKPEETAAAVSATAPAMTEAPRETAAPVEAPAVTEAPVPTATPGNFKNGGTKYVGTDKDIKPGRYVATGNGMVKVYNSDDELKTSILLTDGKDQNGNGVDSYVLNLADGQRLEYADHINLKPYTAVAAASATSAPRATATAAPRTAATATSQATSAPQTAANKTNPKTGDNTPIAGISVVAVFALGMAVFMQISKRRDD